MATTTTERADSPTLKRSFSAEIAISLPLTAKKLESSLPAASCTPLPNFPTTYRTAASEQQKPRRRSAGKSRQPSSPNRVSMPVQATSRSFASPMRSFMSVFGEEANTRRFSEYIDDVSSTQQPLNRPATSGNTYRANNPGESTFAAFHQHNDSTSTATSGTSDSSDSSPTTTISTVDSSSATDPSPGISPESPASTISPSSCTVESSTSHAANPAKMEPHQAPFFEFQRPAVSTKKARNLKNLAVNTAGAYPLGRAVSTASLPLPSETRGISSPTSSSFVKPPTPPRRKPGNLGLTIMTPANSSMPTRLAIPPTPSFMRPNTLRHFQSSPSLPLFSPSVGPPQGMQLPPSQTQPPAPRGFAEVPLEDDEDEPNFDVPQSREEKPEAYPDGPICIYESGVDLYFEPTAEVASKYDVIMNVASEVKNPFRIAEEAALLAGTVGDAGATQRGFQLSSTLGVLSEEAQSSSSPDTPKATSASPNILSNPLPVRTTTQPEYIHIPWEHNTDIVPDLYNLVKLIDERVQQGKRVLVHCQCGVSRSASLIVAYGLYKNPEMSVQEAYDAVKKRSKWIGPNMNLIMQLQEFRSGLLRAAGDSPYQNRLFGSGQYSSRLSSGLSSSKSFGIGASPGVRSLRTAPLPLDVDTSPQRASTGNMGPLSAGPVAAPSAMFWEPGYRRSWGASQSNYDLSAPPVPQLTEMPYVDTKGHVVPVLTPASEPAAPTAQQESESHRKDDEPSASEVPNFSRQLPPKLEARNDSTALGTTSDLQSPRSADFAMGPLKHDLPDDDFGILSPIATEFSGNLFDRATFFGTSNRDTGSQRSFLHPSRDHDSTSSRPTPKPLVLNNTPPAATQPTSFYGTPPQQPSRPNFSPPRIHDQLRLHQLQSSMEAQLPPRSPASPSEGGDDFEALMSPRATEFTNNPFHTTFGFPDEREASMGDAVAGLAVPTTPKKSEEDPRSPPQVGISPITRNIFDVL